MHQNMMSLPSLFGTNTYGPVTPQMAGQQGELKQMSKSDMVYLLWYIIYSIN